MEVVGSCAAAILSANVEKPQPARQEVSNASWNPPLRNVIYPTVGGDASYPSSRNIHACNILIANAMLPESRFRLQKTYSPDSRSDLNLDFNPFVTLTSQLYLQCHVFPSTPKIENVFARLSMN